MHSAARTRTEAGAAGSISIFNSVVAAAVDPCWSRAVYWPNAARLASRYSLSNSGTLIQRKSVFVPMSVSITRAPRSSSMWRPCFRVRRGDQKCSQLLRTWNDVARNDVAAWRRRVRDAASRH